MPINRPVKVDLQFNANIKEAKAQIESLQNSLTQLAKNTDLNYSFPNGNQMKEVSNAALELQQHLTKAFNVKTGNLDLSKLSASLSKSGKTLRDYRNTLAKIGPEGTKAFSEVTNAIALAERPVITMNEKMGQFLTTLKNTVNWQISSSILHGFMGAIQSAYGYAQDLNESLNNIRIVTGKSADEMADFAKQANEAAKALSTTTTQYTDAALIFYQQGLDGEAVTQRADTVIKLANVTRQSAEDVSSYMTAIWNNFYDGSESLEHYADVITALGAATASSSAEIATGLEKFSSIASTVGLSYDYATTALATVVAQTRQSADIVGTAFKTLFARIQDLELGKTLEDGTDLGKYSQALDTIGVKIKDVNGQVRSMDDILDDMGKKWQTIDKATQIAVAQTVAGTRQYTQLIALMDNWDKFQSNLGVAQGAEGTLSEQAEIYAESWEAAQKRVKASMQGLYDDIVNDKFFITMTNGIAKLVEGIDSLIKGLGGIPGILSMISGLFMQHFAYKVPEFISNLHQNWKVFTGQAKSDMLSIQQDAQVLIDELVKNKGGSSNPAAAKEFVASSINKAQIELTQNANKLTEAERASYQLEIEYIKKLGEEVELRAKALTLAQGEAEVSKNNLINAKSKSSDELAKEIDEKKNNFNEQRYNELMSKTAGDTTNAEADELEKLKLENEEIDELIKKYKELQDLKNYQGFNKTGLGADADKEHYFKDVTSPNGIDLTDMDNVSNVIEKLTSKSRDFDELSKSINNSIKKFEEEKNAIDETGGSYDSLIANVKAYIEQIKTQNNLSKQTISNAEKAGAQKGPEGSIENLMGQLEQYKQETLNISSLVNDKLVESTDKVKDSMSGAADAIDKAMKAEGDLSVATGNAKESIDAMTTSLNEYQQKMQSNIAEKLADPYYKLGLAIGSVSTATMTLSSVFRTVDSLMNENMSTSQKLIAVLGALGVVMRAVSFTYDLLTAKTTFLTWASKNEIATKLFLIEVNGALRVSMLSITVVIGAMVAAIAIATAVYKAHIKVIEKAAEAEEQKLQKDKEMRESLQEQKDNLDNLLESYDNLVKKQQDGEITAAQLKDQTYQLCIQYGQEEIAVKSLSASYTDLRKAILDVQSANNKELNESSKRALSQSQSTAQADIKKALKESQRDGQKVDFTGISASSTQKLKELGIDLDTWGKANLEDIARIALDESKREILNELSVEDDIFKTIVDSSKDAFEEAQASRKSYIESVVESTYTKDSFNENDFGDFNNAINSLTNEVIDEIYSGEVTPEQEKKIREQVIHSFAIMSDEYSKLSQKASLIDLIVKHSDIKDSDELEKYTQNVAERMGNLTEKEIGALASNFDLFSLMLKGTDKKSIDDAVKRFLNTFKSSIELQGKMQLQNTMDEILKSGARASQTQINELFDKENFSPSISKESFEFSDVNTQSSLILQERIKNMKEIIELQEKANEEKKKAIEYELNELTIQKAKLGSEFGATSAADADIILQEKTQQLEDAANQIVESYKVDLDTAYKLIEAKLDNDYATMRLLFKDVTLDDEAVEERSAGILNTLNKNGIGSKEQVNAIQKYNNEIKISEEELKNLAKQIETTDVAAEEYKKDQAAAVAIFDAYNKKLDGIQSAYKTLMSAYKEYAADGYITADTYQALLNLSPQYLACLVNEKGQLDINKETIKQVTAATYDNIAAEKLRQIEIDVTAIEEQRKTWAQLADIYTLDLYTQSVNENADALINRIQHLNATSDAEKQVRENMIKSVEAIVAYNKAAKAGLDKDFDAAMGVGKKASEKDKKDLKKYDDEFDRYHDIKEVLEELADAISDVEKQQKHLYGKELARSLREENSLLEQQEAAYRELGAQQKQEQSELVASLSSMGVAFDQTSGQITNYAQATAAALQTLNEAITAYNASAQTEADKKILEAAQKNYDEFKKKLERYDALIEEIRDTENKLDDLFYKKLENNLKAWEAEIKFTLDIRDAEKAWKKFVNTMNEDFKSVFKDVRNQLKGLAEQANDLIKKSGSIDVRLGAMQDIQNEIDKLMAGEESSMFASVSEAQEKLKEYIKDLQSDAEELYNLYRQAWDAYLDGIDQAIDRFDDLNNQYERLDDNLNHQARMIELLYGEQAYDFLSELYDAESKSLLGQLDSLNKQIEFYKSQYEDAVDKWGADSAAAQKWKEAWEGAIDELHAKEEAYIEAIQNKARNAIDKIFYDLERKMTNGLGLQKMQEHWQDALAAAEDYYDEVEKIYQIDRIENLYKQAIDSTSSIKAQQRLSSIMDDQVNSLEKKTNLSKYDIELAEKRLQVYQAQIALEDAQNNKTSMKLTRGEDGNWSYQYVADEEDVANKQQALLDKQNELYEFTKTRWQDLQGEIIELTSTAFTRIHELENESLGATTERQAEIAEELVYLRDYYFGEEGLITMKVRQSNEIQRNVNEETANLLWTLYDTDYENYARMNEKEQALLDQLITNGVNGYENLYDTVFHSYESISDLIEEINADSINTWTEAAAEIIRLWNSDDGDSVLKNIEEAITKCTDILNEYFEDIQKGTEAAGEDFTDVSSKIKDVTDKVQELDGTTEEMIENTKSELSEYESYLKQCEEAWNRMKNTLVNAMETAISYLSKVGDGIKRQVENMRSLTAAANEAYAAAQRAISAGGSVGGGSGEKEVFWGHSDQEIVKRYEKEKRPGESLGEFVRRIKGATSMSPTGYDSGGYTGSWHGEGLSEFNDGKLAILHQKELVLNESDTSNILKVVDIVRSMGQSILSGLNRRFSSFDASNIVNNNKETSNTFNITAEFPNANNVDDIREAILSLPNIASQYVYEK